MNSGLEIFEIVADSYNELAKVEKENEHLDALWTLKDQWDDFWLKNQGTQFYDLEI
jgi:hypothetical protein